MDVGVAVLRFGLEIAAEGGFSVGMKDGKIKFVFIGGEQGAVVGQQFGKQGEGEEAEEDPQAPPAAAVSAESGEAAAGEGERRMAYQ